MTIHLIATGGTIDKYYNPTQGKLTFEGSHIPEMLAQGNCEAELYLEVLMQVDSLDITDTERTQIINTCVQSTHQHIVLTHGTDTMVLTAQALQQRQLAKTIVLTGAMIPYTIRNSDALFNLGFALGVVQCLPNGVYVAMNGRIFNADNVVKNKVLGRFETL
ncbi:asparaginase domain-containing protein [Thiofilum flexile]|uniref:asparaginase domain-containing protein n=1 Tax=Thiofilum flexile TaxID=125627 RepID=UPI0003758B3B|nr:asparaginase domain-containing protein [Thiofilum flexile]